MGRVRNPLAVVRQTLRPAAFHGRGVRGGFFEGWYVKAIDPARRERLAVILGILRPPEQTKEHAFIQIFDGLRGQAGNIRFAASEFSASASVMDARLGRCRLTEHGLSLDVDREDVTLRGRIELGKLTP